MLYFAYGSNMDVRQMRRRCPSARFVAVAKLPDFELTFPIRSTRRRCAAAGIAAAPGQEVWGVIYRLTAFRDIAALDRAEGYKNKGSRKNRYQRLSCRIFPENHSAIPVIAFTYYARNDRYSPLPSEDYLNQLRHGATHWGLPPEYQNFLVNIESA